MIGHFDLKFILTCDSYSLCHMRCLWEFKPIFICQNWLTKWANLQIKNTDSTKLGKLLKLSSFQNKGSLARSSSQVQLGSSDWKYMSLTTVTLNVPRASTYSQTSIIWTCFFGSSFSWILRSYFRVHSKTFILEIMWWNSKSQICTWFILAHAVV